MGGIKSNLLIKATKYNNKKTVKFTLGLFSMLDKFFSAINPFKQRKSFNNKSNEHLDHALPHAIENLNDEIIKLLVNAGADVNLLDKNGKNAITHAIERLAASKGLLDPYLEKVISHPIVRFLLEKGAECDCTDDMGIEGKHANNTLKENIRHPLQPPKKPPRTFEYDRYIRERDRGYDLFQESSHVEKIEQRCKNQSSGNSIA